jgi:hypothetical protein
VPLSDSDPEQSAALLESVRHQLEVLTSARFVCAFTAQEAAKHDRFCREEEELLEHSKRFFTNGYGSPEPADSQRSPEPDP